MDGLLFFKYLNTGSFPQTTFESLKFGQNLWTTQWEPGEREGEIYKYDRENVRKEKKTPNYKGKEKERKKERMKERKNERKIDRKKERKKEREKERNRIESMT